MEIVQPTQVRQTRNPLEFAGFSLRTLRFNRNLWDDGLKSEMTEANLRRGVDGIEEGESMEVRVAGVHALDAVLAHEHGGMRVVHQVAAQA